MISIDRLYKDVNQRIANDFQSGFTNNSEFNLKVNLVSRIIFDYYLSGYDTGIDSNHKLKPFNKALSYYGEDGVFSLPSDFEKDISAAYYQGFLGDRTVKGTFKYVNSEKWEAVLSNYVKRKGSYYSIQESKIFFYGSGSFEKQLRYFKSPSEASRAVTNSSDSITEIYDASNTVDLEWDMSAYNDFVTLLVVSKGIDTEKSNLVNYAQLHSLGNNLNN